MGQVLDAEASPISAFEFWQVCRAKQLFAKEHLDHWNATEARTGTGRPVDAIIAPACAGAPQEHGKPQ
jgi:amidase